MQVAQPGVQQVQPVVQPPADPFWGAATFPNAQPVQPPAQPETERTTPPTTQAPLIPPTPERSDTPQLPVPTAPKEGGPFVPQVLPPAVQQTPAPYQPPATPPLPAPSPPATEATTPEVTTTTTVMQIPVEQVPTFLPMRPMRLYGHTAPPSGMDSGAAGTGGRFAAGILAGAALSAILTAGAFRGAFHRRGVRQAAITVSSPNSQRSPTGEDAALLHAASVLPTSPVGEVEPSAPLCS